MKLGIMQPYFFPYLGYFNLINHADRWIVFDTAQYIRHGWVNRNRILRPRGGWQYIIVPLKKCSRETAIKDVVIDNRLNWKDRVTGQLQHYRKAPHFKETMRLVKECLAPEEDSLARMNTSILAEVCAHIGIDFDSSVFSQMALKIGPVNAADEWALGICKALGADEYINAPGGERLFDKEKYRRNGIRLTFGGLPPLEYESREFIPDLSIIDLLMWNEPRRIKSHLEQHK